MKVIVQDEKCLGCGSCVSLTDQKIFDYNEDGRASVVQENLSEQDLELVKQAMEYCPTDAIEIIEEK